MVPKLGVKDPFHTRRHHGHILLAVFFFKTNLHLVGDVDISVKFQLEQPKFARHHGRRVGNQTNKGECCVWPRKSEPDVKNG